jgi:hypothetical protein
MAFMTVDDETGDIRSRRWWSVNRKPGRVTCLLQGDKLDDTKWPK